MNALMDLGAWTLEQIRHVGRMAIFALQLFIGIYYISTFFIPVG